MTAKKPPAAPTRPRPALYVTRDGVHGFAQPYRIWAPRPTYSVKDEEWLDALGCDSWLKWFCAREFERLTGVSMPGGPTSIRKLTVRLTKVRT